MLGCGVSIHYSLPSSRQASVRIGSRRQRKSVAYAGWTLPEEKEKNPTESVFDCSKLPGSTIWTPVPVFVKFKNVRNRHSLEAQRGRTEKAAPVRRAIANRTFQVLSMKKNKMQSGFRYPLVNQRRPKAIEVEKLNDVRRPLIFANQTKFIIPC
jgi:hypothetical protein